MTLASSNRRSSSTIAAGTERLPSCVPPDPPPPAPFAAERLTWIVVASGRVTILDYRGYTVDAARAALEAPDIKLTVDTLEDPTCPAMDPPTVSQQSLAPGDVPVHSTITLTYCTGAPPGDSEG